MKLITFLPLFLFLVNTTFAQTINWQHTNGPEGIGDGTLWNDDQFAYYSDDFFLYRTSDGKNWEKISSGGTWLSGYYKNYMVVQFPDKANAPLYYLKGSSDHGITWETIPLPKGNFKYANSVAVCSHGIYISVYDNKKSNSYILKTENKGVSWDTLKTLNPPYSDLYQIDNRVYFRGQYYLYRSDSTGYNWEKCNPGIAGVEQLTDIVGSFPMITIVSNLYITTWNQSTNEITKYNNNFEITSINLINDTLYGINYITGKLYRSVDWGIGWNLISKNSKPYPSMKAKFKNIFQLYSYPKEGVYKFNNDSFVFENINNNLTSATSEELINNSLYLYNLSPNGIQRFEFNKKLWETDIKLYTAQIKPDKMMCNKNGNILAYSEYNYKGFYLSKDNGNTFDTILNLNDLSSIHGEFILLDSTVILTDKYLKSYIYNISSQTWSANVFPLGVYNSFVKFKDKLYGIFKPWDKTRYKVFVRYENSGIQDSINFPADFSPNYLLKTDDLLMLVGVDVFNKGVYYISKNGSDWQLCKLYESGIKKVVGEGDKIIGLFENSSSIRVSVNAGINWRPVSIEPFLQLAIHDNQLYAGGFGNGVFVTDFDEFFKAITTSDNLISVFENSQIDVFPNPTSENCTIRLRNNDDKLISVELYNANGQQIGNQININQENECQVQLSSLTEGIYFFKIRTEKGTYLHKVIKGH